MKAFCFFLLLFPFWKDDYPAQIRNLKDWSATLRSESQAWWNPRSAELGGGEMKDTSILIIPLLKVS